MDTFDLIWHIWSFLVTYMITLLIICILIFGGSFSIRINWSSAVHLYRKLFPKKEKEYYNDTCCPKCGWEPPSFDGRYYTVKGKEYPIFSGVRRYYNGHFDMNDWDETHCCPKYKKEYTFGNGAV